MTSHENRRFSFQTLIHSFLPWIRVAVEKPTAGPGGAKEEGRRGRLWSPWTSLSGTAPIGILDVEFHWFIFDRSREITHSLLCNLLSGRSPTNQSTQVQAVGVSMYCFILLVSAARLYRWRIKQVLYLWRIFQYRKCCFKKEFCRNKFLYFATVRSLELINIS